MVAASASQQQQQATAPVPSAEEDTLKRNTDCVYFLASPLTCKKGSECEYRHSEYARINPRDCYFWLNRNCLNPKCGFRHPPLDGLFGTQAATSTGSSVPQSQMAAAPASYAPQNSSTQAVPCFYFQKGLCLKGERCAFSHGPSLPNNKISQPVIPSAATEPPSQTKSFGGPKKFAQDRKFPQTTSSKTVEMYADAKLESKAEISSRRNGAGVGRIHTPSESMHNEVPKAKTTNLHPVVNGNASRFNRMHQSQVQDDQSYQNGKDADEYLRESSPGFDVLVDDELRNSDFYRGEDQYGRTASHEGTNLNLVDEYDKGHSADYNSVSDFDREAFHDPRGYDTYGHMQGQYVWDQHRASSERMQLGPAHLERRGYSRADSSEQVDADLRHRLRNQRRATGLRSVVSHDFVSDDQVQRGHRGAPRRDSQSIGGRLHGRIKLPGRSSSGSDLGGEDEVDKGRNWGRLSPGRSQNQSHQGRLRDRIKARAEENYNSEERSLRGTQTRREMADDWGADFVGPKSLAELKGTKSAENMTQQSTRKRKQLDNNQSSEGDLSFDGPMPLSEILKRKREAGAAASGSGMSSDQHNNNQKESKEGLLGGSSNNAAVAETEGGVLIVKDEANEQVLKDEEESKPEAAAENTESGLGQYSSLPSNPSAPETGDGMIGGDGVEDDQEYEVDGQREEDYEYEQGDEGEYYEEGENVEGEEEYADEEDGDDFTKKIDEDGDDFAKKIGVMFS